MLNWKVFNHLRVLGKLRMGANSTILLENADHTVSTIDLTELAAIDAIGAADLAKIDGITNGTVAAGKAIVVDSNKDAGDCRNFDAVNFDAGASGTAGSVDIFPSTASKGKVALTAADSAGDTTTTIVNASQSGARTYTIPDAGASASFVMTEGSQTVNGTKTIAALVTTNLDAGASGTAGSVDVFPTTASKGKFILSCADQDGDTSVTLQAAGMAQASVISIPDPGAATANVMLTDAANDQAVVTATAAEINMAADNSANVEVVTTTNVITAAESGKTFFLNSATGFDSSLPAAAAGLRFKFVVTTIPTSGNCTVTSDNDDNIIEGMADVNSTLVLAANEDSINFVASTCLIGDWVEVISNGTSWFVTGQSGAAGGITFTAA